jgi:hypothetical protein
MIRNIQLSHSGKYLCTVQTTLEHLSAAADIIVRGKNNGEKMIALFIPNQKH